MPIPTGAPAPTPAQAPAKPAARCGGGATDAAALGGVLGDLAAGKDAGGAALPVAKTVPLAVLPSPKNKIAKSKMGPWRAAVLTAIHLVIAAHIVQWLIHGMTLSPVEPSESMYTLETGRINAGFVMFVLAIASTLLLGRFFCGWACHVVALQDACGWMMKKLGVRPKPLRSRLLIYGPLVLALYMFVWPTFKREALRPAAEALGWWDSMRAWLGESPPPVFRSLTQVQEFFEPHFIVRDFWATFPPWYVAVPFLLVCGFACVYLLGAKGFCTYGCPYGGFFAPADRLAPGRIRVTDACEHCGHCTSVCTSNVRVHEEVRDYGMVVDPGCMKCLDCVSVCPNDALYVGFGKPAILAKPKANPKDPAAKKPRFKDRVHDWSRREELLYGLLFFLFTIGFRGMMGLVPLLMAMGLAGCAVFLTWKLVQLVREPSVRLQSLQLKHKGRVTAWGAAVALLGAASLAAGLWGAAVKLTNYTGLGLSGLVKADLQAVYSPAYTPAPEQKARAQRALRLLKASTAPHPEGLGGWGWYDGPDHFAQLAWMSAVAGDPKAAEAWFVRGLDAGAASPADASENLLNGVAFAVRARGGGPGDVAQLYQGVIQRHPATARTRLKLAQVELARGNAPAAREQATRVLAGRSARDPLDPNLHADAAGILIQVGDLDAAKTALDALTAATPELGRGHAMLGLVRAQAGDLQGALDAIERAVEREPENPQYLTAAAQLSRGLGRADQAKAYEDRARAAPRPGPR